MSFVYKHYVDPAHMKEEFEFIFTILQAVGVPVCNAQYLWFTDGCLLLW
jgi:hypothetical protein